jgi:two-component system chemotaxis response regulator CheY
MARRDLIVDNSPTMRKMVAFTLREAGIDLLEATDGAEALRKADGQQIDLIITDLNMPVMDGLTLIRRVRSIPATEYVPILMLTTETDTDKKLQAKSVGATGWLVKPFDPAKLPKLKSRVLP